MTQLLKIRQWTGRTKAQGMVEFALALPVVLALMLGIIEMGRLLAAYSAVYTASREAVRYGTANGVSGTGWLYYQDCPGMRAAAVRVGSLGGVRESDVDIRYDHGPTDPPTPFESLPECNETIPYPAEGEVDLGDRVIVRVTTGFEPIVPLVNLPPINISSTTARTVIRDVDVMGTPLPSPTLQKTYTATVHKTPTPTSTATLIPTETPTVTVTSTVTQGPSPTPTFTRTITATRTVTATRTITGTPTISATPTTTLTPTPSATPKDDCSKIELKEPGSGNRLPDNKFNIEIRNKLKIPLVIRSVSISWDGGSQLNNILLDNGTVWTGSAPSPRLWVPDAEYTVGAANPEAVSRILGFTFSWDINTKPIIAVLFDNNCIAAYLP